MHLGGGVRVLVVWCHCLGEGFGYVALPLRACGGREAGAGELGLAWFDRAQSAGGALLSAAAGGGYKAVPTLSRGSFFVFGFILNARSLGGTCMH